MISRTTSAARLLGRVLLRSRVALVFAALVVAAAIVTGSAVGPASRATRHAWGAGEVSTLHHGRWWTLGSALVVPADAVQTVVAVVLVLALVGVAQRFLGARRTVVALVATGIGGVVLGVGLQAIGTRVDEWWATGTSVDLTLDPLTPVVGALLAATASMSRLWRRRTRVTTFSFLVMFALYDGDSSNVYRVLAGLLGLALGAWFARDRAVHHPGPVSRRELRTLLATIVAVTAIGPVVTLLSSSGNGPFFFLGELFADGLPDPADTLATCAGDVSAQCAHDLALVSLSGPGPFLLTFAPLVLLLVSARGLRRGRRLALVVAVAVDLALAVLAFFSLDLVASIREFSNAGEYVFWVAAAVLVPAGTATLLLVNARAFSVRAPRRATLRWGLGVIGALVVLTAVYVAVALPRAADFVPAIGTRGVLLDALRRYVPLSFFGESGALVVPGDRPTMILASWIGPIFWAVVVLAVLALFRATSVAGRAGDAERFRELLRNGGGTLAFLGTWPGNSYWFDGTGTAAVAYRVVNGVAITTADPVCPPEGIDAAIRGFVRHCETNGWTPVLYSVHEQCLPTIDALGWQRMSVGEETLVHPAGFALEGRAWQKVRQPLNKAIKLGITAEWTSWSALPLSMVDRITQLSEQWVSEKELPEMGFTLGGLEELKDPEVRLMLAIGPDGGLQAITSWMPTRRDGRVVGWTLDFMRRADDSMNGIMEFVIASAALRMREDGIEVLSLSGAPLATAPVQPGEEPAAPTAMTRLLDFLARTLEPAYGFSSLFRFKAKFNPSYSTIWMAYADPLALPAIGTAIGRAYLPEVSASEALALVRTLRGPAGAAAAAAGAPAAPPPPSPPTS